MIHASCNWAGKIFFSRIAPGQGDFRRRVHLASCKSAAALRNSVQTWARLAYDNHTLLVPGVPEAENLEQAAEAMRRFSIRIKEDLKELEGLKPTGANEQRREILGMVIAKLQEIMAADPARVSVKVSNETPAFFNAAGKYRARFIKTQSLTITIENPFFFNIMTHDGELCATEDVPLFPDFRETETKEGGAE